MAREALRHTSRAYFFDNSRDDPLFVAESEDGGRPEMRSDTTPGWFQTYILDRY